MKNLRQLTPADVMFIGGETPSVYQHTAGLVLLESSERPDFGFEEYRQHIASRLDKIPQFHWRLHEVPLGLDLPYWVEDESFSYDHHIRRIAVPSPGDDRALAEVVSYLYSRHLDRSRPLWEIWFIEGLSGGNFAILQKMHHCMMDGEGASKLVEAMCDFEPDPPPRAIDPSITNARPGDVPEHWRRALNTAIHLYGMPLRISREAIGAIRHGLSKRIRAGGQSDKKPVTPTTSFNADISGERGFVYGSVSLEKIKAVKSHFGVTVNDVVLALVGSSLRDYLLQRGELPDESLRTSIAVSLRTESDDEFSNHVTVTTVTLATDREDPVQRLQAIAAESARAKDEAHHGGKGVMEFMQLLPPLLVNAMMNMAPADQVAQMAGVNLIVSSVRGSERPLYVAGVRMNSMYPMSIISPGGGVNVTCVSYAGNVDFGVTIEPSMVPDPWRIIDGLHKALEDYQALIPIKGNRGKKSPGAGARRGSARRKKPPARTSTSKKK